MDLENFKDLIFTKDISQINNADLSALMAEYPYFDILNLVELIHIKHKHPQRFSDSLSSSGIYFSDKKRLYQMLNSNLRNELIEEFGKEGVIKLEETEAIESNNDPSTEKLLDFSYTGAKKNEVAENDKPVLQKEVENSDKEPTLDKKISLIDRFLIEDPGPIRADKKTNLTGDVSKTSVIESENLLTDTLAKIYVKQGLFNKAIFAYEKLSLKYPEKSVYFASQIKEIKETINKK